MRFPPASLKRKEKCLSGLEEYKFQSMQLGEWKKKNEHLGAKNTFISESVQDVKSDVSPCCCTCDDLQTAWVPDELVQNADNLLKLGSVVSVLLPAI